MAVEMWTSSACPFFFIYYSEKKGKIQAKFGFSAHFERNSFVKFFVDNLWMKISKKLRCVEKNFFFYYFWRTKKQLSRKIKDPKSYPQKLSTCG